MGVHENFGQLDVRLRQALDYDNSVAPADGQVVGWWNGGGTFQPQTVISQYQRGPIGGTSASTLVTQTYSLDATGAIFRRFTLTGNPTLSVPTGGVDGQKLTLWLFASGADRTFIFATGYEVSPQVPSRVITIANGTWERFDLECRNGTWRIVGTDQLLFSAADIGGLTQAGADARYARGVLARNRRTSNSAANASTTNPATVTPVSRVAAPVVAGRLYRVGAPLLMWAPSANLSAYHLCVAILNFTTDGSNPTPAATSALLLQTHTGLPVGAGAAQPVAGHCAFPWVATFTGTLTITLSIYRGAGTAASIYLLYGAAYPIDLLIEDLGVDPGSSGAAL